MMTCFSPAGKICSGQDREKTPCLTTMDVYVEFMKVCMNVCETRMNVYKKLKICVYM